MFRRSVISSALLLGTSLAQAGTMGDATYDFDGFYAGLGAGFISLFTNDTFSTTRSNGVGGNADTNKYTDTAILFTGQIGYGKMVRPQVYLGGKASIYYTPMETLDETGFSTSSGSTLLINGNNSITTTLKPIYNIDAVLGYEVLPHILPFVEAGVSFAEVNRSFVFKRSRSDLATPLTTKYESTLGLSSYKVGANAGLGVSYQPSRNWFLSTEVVYNYLGKSSGSVTTSVPNTTSTETQHRSITSNSVSMFTSISYLFDM